jgi:CRISPR-associated protein Cas1
LIKLDRVILMGRGVGVTTAALYEFAQRKIDVIYLRRGGGFGFRVQGGDHKHSQLRYRQSLAIARPEVTLPIAQAIVAGKIRNQRVLIQRHAREANLNAAQALAGMEAMQARALQTKTFDELRGMEGNAASEYFGIFRQLLVDRMGFERREYYPPPDPLNALLSFGYTLLLRETESAVLMAGLDPALGVLHVIDYGRPSLALDLEEEFRAALVDSIVLQAINTGTIRRDDFEATTVNEKRGWKLKDEPRKKFLGLYEARLMGHVVYPLTNERTTWRRVLLLQAQQLARVFLGEAKGYEAMEIR